MSYSSGVDKSEFTKWIADTCKALMDKNREISLPWEESPTEENDAKKTDCSVKSQRKEIVKFMCQPKRLEKIKYLVLSEDQRKPTLKVISGK